MILSRRNERAGVCSAIGRHLSGMCKALGSIPDSPLPKKQKKKNSFQVDKQLFAIMDYFK